MGKASKSTKKFASSGQLKKVIQARHKHQQIRKRTQGKRGARDGKDKPKIVEKDVEENEEAEEEKTISRKSAKGKGCVNVWTEDVQIILSYFLLKQASHLCRWLTWRWVYGWHRWRGRWGWRGSGLSVSRYKNSFIHRVLFQDMDDDESDDGEEDDFADDASFASVDDLEGMFTLLAWWAELNCLFSSRGRRNTSYGVVQTCRERSRIL